MVNNGSRILIDFDMIFDIDVGIIRTIDEKYCDESIFYKEVTNLDDELLQGLLYRRTMVNPLQVAFIDESMTEEMDSIYDQLLMNEFEDIVLNSTPTAIYDIIQNFINGSNGTVIPTILCRNYFQRKIAIQMFSEYDYGKDYKVVLNQNDIIKLSGFSDLMIKDVRSLVYFRGLEGMNIFIADLMMNYDLETYENSGTVIPIKEIASLYSRFCILKFIEMYPYDNSYFFDGDFDDEDEVEESIASRNNEFVKTILGEDILDQSIETDKLDNYDEDEDPYDSNMIVDVDDTDYRYEDEDDEDYFDESNPDDLEDGDEIIVDESIEFSPDYVPQIYHSNNIDEDDEDDYEEEDFDPMVVLPELIKKELQRNRLIEVNKKYLKEKEDQINGYD